MINLNNVQSAKWRFRWVTIFLTSLLVIAISLSGQFVMQTAYAAPELIGNIATSISAGADYNCEIRSDSTLTCWGNSDDNQTLAPAGTFTQVSAGTVHTCAIKSDGTIACWGDNSEGQSTPPTGIFKRITAGTVHTCAIKSDDTLACWGNDDDHQVSDAPGGTFKQISAGDFHTCGIKSDDTIKCWGNDDDHQLDAPSGAFKQVSAGGSHTCAIQIDNIVKCWGTNDDGESSPPAGAFIQVSAGSAHTCGIKSNNTVACWGDDSEDQTSPPAGLFTQISAGDVHNCGIRSNGTVSCWGNNDNGQAPQLALTPVTLSIASVGVAYSQLISTTAENYTPVVPNLSISTGGLPTGINLIATPGTLNGTPLFAGTYGFTLRSLDANGLSGERVYTLKVNTVPIANNLNIIAAQSTPTNTVQTNITLVASDADASDSLTYLLVSNPGHGTLSGTVPNLVYTPAANYTGADSFTFKVNDGQADSNVATVSITVKAAGNTPPVADDQNIATNRNQAKSITLSASDAENNPLSYTLLITPTHGTLSGTAPTLVYTPNHNYTGADSFTFKVNDGHADSDPATITITVNPFNTQPNAHSLDAITLKNTPLTFILTGYDDDDDALTYSIVSQPVSGTLSGTLPNVTYTPNTNFIGDDSFTFKVNDGQASSNVATVRILVRPNVPTANKAPLADDQNATVARNTAKNITLTASDTENDPLTYQVISQPANGALSGTAPALTYTPKPGFTGSDSFTFQAYDGKNFSGFATISIQVISPPVAPVANAQNVTLPKNTIRSIVLTASDDNGDALTYSVLSQPTHGTLSGTAPNLIYTPNPDYTGSDSFTFKANDGQADSNTAAISITVTADVAVNTPPIANAQNATTAQETAKNITLTASDADGNPLTYSIVSNPLNGLLSGSAPNLIYTPNAGFTGVDSFTFKVNDGKIDSNTATVTINAAKSDAQGSITGIIYDDKNSNGQKDSDEPGIPNVTVMLSDAATNRQAVGVTAINAERRTTTNNDGVYHFGAVAAGNYNLTVVLPFGFETAGPTAIAITVGATGEVTPAPLAIKSKVLIFLPLIRR